MAAQTRAMDAVVQRDREVSALTGHVERVTRGAGSVVLVEGPAGIGKSTLLGVTIRIAQNCGVRVLRAWGSPLEYDAGWGIARQLLAPVRRGPEWDDLAVGTAALALSALDPQPQRPPSGAEAMHAATHGLTWLAHGLAERAPTLFVVDDAHWADAQSLRWLSQLSRQVADLPLGIVCAVRSGERPSDPSGLTEIVAAASGPAVRPAPLEPDAVAAVVRNRWPAAGRTFTRACHAATAGNPFLLRALLDALADDDLTPSDELALRLTDFGPTEVTRSVERQLSRLPDGSVELAHAVAVLDRNVALRHAAELARLEPERAARLADGLRAAGLVDSSEAGFALVHPLVASALYGGLAPGHRAALHGRAAAVLQRDRADPETVALHLLHTQPYRRAQTVSSLRLAAELASRRGAPDTATAFLRRALDEPPHDSGTEAEVRSELGLVLAAQVRPGAVALLHQSVDLVPTAVRRAELALSGARALGMAGSFDDAVQLCRRGHRPDQDVPSDLLDQVAAELTGMCFLDARTSHEGRRRLAERCSGPDVGQPPLPRLWPVLAAWGTQLDARAVSETRHLLEGLRPDAMQAEPDSLICTIAKFVHIFNEDFATACALCEGLIDLARPRGWQIALAHGSFIRAFALVRTGRIREAATDGRAAFDFKLGNSPPGAIMWSLTALVDALVELDALDEADEALRKAWEQAEPPADGLGTAFAVESRARLRLAQGRHEQAICDLCTAARMWDRLQVRHPGVATWRIGMSQALVALGDRAAARRFAQDHRVLAEQVGLPGPQAAALHALADATGGQQAVVLLEQARELLRQTPTRLEHVRTLVGLGAALRRANRRTDARDVLREALDLAERGGMRLLARRAQQELTATGARPRRNRTSGVDALTPAEHRVATLAARGRTNPQIAQELFVTRRTVETHLTHAFTKLDIAARSELANALTGAE
jgi:DNA-binding NarL/FixJ family response regulator